jgi:phenylalanyl-tRNA synthetase alpha chain
MSVLSPEALARDLTIPDLSADPTHVVGQMVSAITTSLVARWGCALRVVRAHPIVSIDDNYERLAFPADAATREARYSRYVSETCLLRTHTSAMIPPALRAMARADNGVGVGDGVGDVLLACPGLVYRRDAIDRLHTGTPHQLDLWRVVDGADRRRPMSVDDLTEMIAVVVAAALPGADGVRTTPAVHPYTSDGLQVDVSWRGEWVEIGECGLAALPVLRGAGLPDSATGLAMGLGLDRLVMLRKGIPDIRLLRSSDPRVVAQLGSLDGAWRPVSNHPPVRRDVSVAVGADVDEESLGDRVRSALGAAAEAVESVQVLTSTEGSALPAVAVERLGLLPGQRNLLVRIVLRHVDRTLTDAEANGLRDRIHAAIHEGTVPLCP